MTHHLNVDLETYSSVPINKAGLYKYVQSPDFQILLFGYSLDGEPATVLDLSDGKGIPPEIVALLMDKNVVKHAYNAAFEWYCISKYLYGDQTYATINWLPQWRDTMLHTLYCGYPASLDAAGKAIGLPEDKRKLSAGKALIKIFCTPHTPTDRDPRTRIHPKDEPEKWELFKTYNAQDVTTEQELERRLSPFPVPPEIQRQWETDIKINARGVGVDMDLVNGALECSDTVTRPFMDEARKITGLENPNSLAQVKSWLKKRGYDITTLRKDDVTALLESGNLDPEAKRVLEIRQKLGKTSVKKYTAMADAVCSDNRIRGTLMFYGANRTGRWAGRIIQPQNLPRTNIHGGMLNFARELVKGRKADSIRLIYGSVPDTLSQLIRTALVPAKGNMFVDADFSSIEARVVAWLAGQTDTLDIFRQGKDIYCATASRMFGVPVEKNGVNKELRQKGKIATLALGYGGSTGALKNLGALKQGLTEEELPDIVQRWRESNQRIRALWYKVESAALGCINTGRQQGLNNLLFSMEGDQRTNQWFMTITLPSGRKLYYARPFVAPGKYGDAIHYWGLIQSNKKGKSQSGGKWQILDTWGGKLVENITQAVARDCLAESIERLEAAGYPIVFHVHDEVIIDIPKEKADLGAVCRIMSEPIQWAPGLPLGADGWVGEYYTKD